MELLDIYDNNGNKTGRVITRGNKTVTFNENEHIAVAIIYIENNNNEFLIQKTSKEKGGLYSSTGGHVIHNEEPIDTIKRETKEELGIDIDNDNIIYLGYLLYDFPIRHMFYLKKDINLDEIKLQKEEVEFVKFMSENEIMQIIDKGLMHEAHAKVLYKVLKYKSKD